MNSPGPERKGIARAAGWWPEVLFLAIATGLYFLLFYRRWPLFEDHGIFHYMAWGLSQGLRPYVDIVDVNWPGIYGVHYLARLISGASPMGLRLLDSGAVFLAGVMLMFTLKELKVGRPARWLAVTAYLLSYYFGGYNNTAQRESFGLAILLLGVLPWVRMATNPRPVAMVWFVVSGLAMAFGIMTRPQVAPLGFVFIVWSFLPAWRQPGAWRRLAGLAAGGLLGVMLFLLWLKARGGLEGFWKWAVVYVFGDYRGWRLPRATMLSYLLRNITTRGGGFAALLLLSGLGVFFFEPGRWRRMREHGKAFVLGLGCLAAGVLMAWVQSKGAPYHCVPLQWALALQAGLLISASRAAAWLDYRARRVAVGCGIALALFAGAAAWVGASPALSARWRPWSVRPTDGTLLARQMNTLLAPGETVVLFDGSAYTFWAELQRRAPFPYISGAYYWMIALGLEDPRAQTILEDLARALNDPAVRFFIVEPLPGPASAPQRSSEGLLREEPAVQRILAAAYGERADLSSDRFKVYERTR